MGGSRTSRRSPKVATSDVDRAIEAFVRGFCFTRSFTHPYVAERVGPVWRMRDGPRRNAKDYRNEEWVAHGVEPAEVDRLVRSRARGGFAICAIHASDESDGPLRAGYKSLGYRLGTTEPLMVHRLKRIPQCNPPKDVQIERVTMQAVADRLARAAGRRQILPEYLTDGDAPLRQYVALAGDGEPVGWVRSIAAGEEMTWCSNMHVLPAFRRRGIGRAMLARMLRDDRAAGARAAVLLASYTGALLYPVVGYEQIGTLLLFTPRRRGPT
jgi:GNAT superfamily N-acetyltransferase